MPPHVLAPWPGLLTEAVCDHRQHIPVPAHTDMAAADFDVMYEDGPFVVATGLPRDHAIRPAVDGLRDQAQDLSGDDCDGARPRLFDCARDQLDA